MGLLGTTGMRAAVLSLRQPHLYREVWDEAPGYDDIMRFWEGPIEMVRALEAQHFIKIYCAVGISSMTRVNDWEKIVGRTPRLTRKPRRRRLRGDWPGPHAVFLLTWPLEEQAACLEARRR